MTYEFLSDEWMAAAKSIREAHADESPAIPATVRANLVITDVPFGEGTVEAHMDTSTGRLHLDTGHLERPDATLTMDHATAKAFIVTQDQAALMQAFMGGKIKIQGDMSKLMALAAAGQAAGPDLLGAAERIQAEIQAITL